jgi:hypothetical protein
LDIAERSFINSRFFRDKKIKKKLAKNWNLELIWNWLKLIENLKKIEINLELTNR